VTTAQDRVPYHVEGSGLGKGRCIRTLLVVMEADWARGPGDIDVIKYRFCSAIVSGVGRTSDHAVL